MVVPRAPMCFDEHVGVLRLDEGSERRLVGMLSVKLYEGRLYKASRNRCPKDPSRGWTRVQVSVTPTGEVQAVSDLPQDMVDHYVRVFEHYRSGRVWSVSRISEVVVDEVFADTAEDALNACFERFDALGGAPV